MLEWPRRAKSECPCATLGRLNTIQVHQVPITYRFDHKLNCFLLRCIGEVTNNEVVAVADGAFRDERIKPGHLRLHDMRAMTGPRTAGALTQFSRLVIQHEPAKPPWRAAIVVSTEIDYGMIRIFIGNLGAAGDAWQAFREMDDAKRWLGLPEDISDPFATGDWTEVVA
jgi:hypothetical protein